jgi:hypothetical protein
MADLMKLNTRIISKHDTLANLNNSSFIPYKGEIVLAEVETKTKDAKGNIIYVPTYLMKVGDGTNKFSALNWMHAPASDVYAWAKQEELPVEDAATYDNTYNVVTGVEFKKTTAHPDGAIVITKDKVATVDSVEDLAEVVSQLDTRLTKAVSDEAKARGDADSALDLRIQPIEEWKRNTNFVTEVKAGNGIEVTGGTTATPTVAVKLDGSAAASGKTKVTLATSDKGLKAEIDLTAYDTIESVNSKLAEKSDDDHTHATGDLTDWADVKEGIDNAIAKAQTDAETNAGNALTQYKNSVATQIGYVDTGKSVSSAISAAVAGEKERAEAAEEALDGRLDAIEGVIGGVTGAMHFIGAFEVAPTKAFAGTNKERNLADGDVYVSTKDHKEYVYSGTAWVELGDTTQEAKRIEDLEKKVDVTKVSTAISEAVAGEADLRAQADEHITKDIIGTFPTGDDAYTTVVAGIAAAKKAGTDAASALNVFVTETAPDTYAGKGAFETFVKETAPATYADKNAFEVFSGTTVPNTYATQEALRTGLAGKSDTGHTHTKADITDFAHKHSHTDITDWDTELAKKADAEHTHTVSEIDDYATDVKSKIEAYGYETVDNVNLIRTDISNNVAKLGQDADFNGNVLQIGGVTVIFDCGTATTNIANL